MDKVEALKMLMGIVDESLSNQDFELWFDDINEDIAADTENGMFRDSHEEALLRLQQARDVVRKEYGV